VEHLKKLEEEKQAIKDLHHHQEGNQPPMHLSDSSGLNGLKFEAFAHFELSFGWEKP